MFESYSRYFIYVLTHLSLMTTPWWYPISIPIFTDKKSSLRVVKPFAQGGRAYKSWNGNLNQGCLPLTAEEVVLKLKSI